MTDEIKTKEIISNLPPRVASLFESVCNIAPTSYPMHIIAEAPIWKLAAALENELIALQQQETRKHE